jgi:hypothetical protein
VRAALALLAAIAVGAVIGLVVVARGGDDLPPADRDGAPGAALDARTAIEPRVALFAEPVTAVAEFLVDPGRVLPDSVRLDAQVEPFRLAAATRTQTRAGDLVRVRYRYRLACTTEACLPDDRGRTPQLEDASVSYTRRDTGFGSDEHVRVQDIVTWPSFRIASRLQDADVERARWRANVADLPAVTERASPIWLGAALLGGSALLALLGVTLIGTQVRRLRPAPPAEVEAQPVTPLERALAGLVASSSNGGGDERRMSLERLARELAATGRPELAARARRLAWSPRPVSGDEVDTLAADVRALVEEQR